MYFRKCAFLGLMIVSFLTQAQSIQWASSVVGYSSQYSGKICAAAEATGAPNAMLPGGKASSVAWLPSKKTAQEYVWVKFATPIKAKQLTICQNLLPGGITKIEVFNENSQPSTIYEGQSKFETFAAKVLTYPIPIDIQGNVASVKVTLNNALKDGYYQQIDAIGISEKEVTYEPKINLVSDIKFPAPPEKLSDKVNSVYGEDDPIVSPDGKFLFINRHNHPNNINGVQDNSDTWVSELEADGTWGTLKNMGSSVNKFESVWPCAAMPDGNAIFVGTNSYDMLKGKFSTGPAFCYRTRNGWSAPERVNIPNCYATGSSSIDYGCAPNGKVIFMAFDRENSYGESDIFVSLNRGGSWTEPINLGKVINTAGKESTPFIAPDNTTMYFCSDGRNGYGGTDIYMTRRLDDSWTNWSEPLNLGPVINTAKDDSEYSLMASGEYAYYVISQDGSMVGKDIYRVKLNDAVKPKPTCLVFGKTLNAKTKEPIEAQIFYESLTDNTQDTSKESGIARSNPQTGAYKIVLPSGKQYGFRAEAKGYLAVDENLSLVDLSKYQEVEKNLYLVPIEIGQSVALNNVFFQANADKLLPSSYAEIDRVAAFLKENPQIKIEIQGHTDNGSSGTAASYLLQLSEARAKAIVDALVKKGVKPIQLRYKGFGNSKPIADNNTVEGRQKNRRVEFIITDK